MVLLPEDPEQYLEPRQCTVHGWRFFDMGGRKERYHEPALVLLFLIEALLDDRTYAQKFGPGFTELLFRVQSFLSNFGLLVDDKNPSLPLLRSVRLCVSSNVRTRILSTLYVQTSSTVQLRSALLEQRTMEIYLRVASFGDVFAISPAWT